MQQLQAVALASVSPQSAVNLKNYFEDCLNCYLYEVIEVTEVINTIYNEGPGRDALFEKLDGVFKDSPNVRIIVFSEPALSGMAHLAHYEAAKGDKEQHELFLRHTVSILHSRYKGKLVEVHVPETSGGPFRKVA
jgi:hypothetical protein